MDPLVIRSVMQQSLKWICQKMVSFILFTYDTYLYGLYYVRSLCEHLRSVIRVAITGNGSLFMFFQQVIFVLDNRNFWIFRLDLFRVNCIEFSIDIVDEVHRFKNEKFPNPWRLVALLYNLQRYISFILLNMRATWYLQKVNYRGRFFLFMYVHHQEWYPGEEDYEGFDTEVGGRHMMVI